MFLWFHFSSKLFIYFGELFKAGYPKIISHSEINVTTHLTILYKFSACLVFLPWNIFGKYLVLCSKTVLKMEKLIHCAEVEDLDSIDLILRLIVKFVNVDAQLRIFL